MVKICGVCKTVIDYCIQGTDDDSRISHGICHDCSEKRKKMKNINDITHVDWPGYTSIKKAEPG